jgi:hypothetical protein
MTPVRATNVVRIWLNADALPVLVDCDDEQRYVVKGGPGGRQIVADHVVAHLGRALGSPTGQPALVEVPPHPCLLDLPNNRRLEPGVWHATRYMPGLSDDRQGFLHTHLVENRSRFSSLAILYGWAGTWDDHQFIYAEAPPELVYSVDHGRFFPDCEDWTIAALSSASTATPDPQIRSACALTDAELAPPLAKLREMDAIDIISTAVGAPLDYWGLSDDERVALADYLLRRHAELSGGTFAMPTRAAV